MDGDGPDAPADVTGTQPIPGLDAVVLVAPGDELPFQPFELGLGLHQGTVGNGPVIAEALGHFPPVPGFRSLRCVRFIPGQFLFFAFDFGVDDVLAADQPGSHLVVL